MRDDIHGNGPAPVPAEDSHCTCSRCRHYTVCSLRRAIDDALNAHVGIARGTAAFRGLAEALAGACTYYDDKESSR